MPALELVCLLVALLLLVPILVLVTESLAALLPGRRQRQAMPLARPRCAVLIPAHNEESGIGKTVTALLPQLQPGDHLVVVADNCSDQTAEAARTCGATVIERHDVARRGKGFALDFGVRFLEKTPPEVVVLVDADCLLTAGSLDVLAREAHARGSPIQAVYLLDQPPGAGIKDQLSSFAFQFKNLVRPLGLDRLGLPCLLTGTGIALPWPLLQGANLASGNIVEDMQLGIDLAVKGHPPRLCAQALVHGELPAGRRAAVTQRTRWEHGHLRTLLRQVPRLVGAAIRQRRLGLAGLALELSVPPLSMLGLLWAAAFVGSLCLGWYEGPGSRPSFLAPADWPRCWPSLPPGSSSAGSVCRWPRCWLRRSMSCGRSRFTWPLPSAPREPGFERSAISFLHTMDRAERRIVASG